MIRTFCAIALILLVYCQPAFAGDLPDSTLTPGANDSSVIDASQTRATLCPVPHTKALRNTPESLKVAVYARYGMIVPKIKVIKNGKTVWRYNFHIGICNTVEGCEVDHLCSLENGCNNSILNLWIQPYSGTPWNAHAKDVLEGRLHKLMCDGKITLAEDQAALSNNWIEAYQKYIGPAPVAASVAQK